MYRAFVAALICAASFVLMASAQGTQMVPQSDGTPLSCDGKKVGFHVDRAIAIIDKSYSRDRYPDDTPMKGREKRALREHKLCVLDASRREHIERHRDLKSDEYRKYVSRRAFREAYTPYFVGERGFRWSAIPFWIVNCETNGYVGEERFDVINEIGAVGPYQLLDKGAPHPVDSVSEKREHHRIASGLWAGGSGSSHWAECGG